MNNQTHCLNLAAPRDRVFGFLSQIENLPKWATLFCQGLRRDAQGRHWIATRQGEMLFRIEADAATGVIDMFGGPSEDAMACWPARVIERPDGGTLFLFTAFQYPGVSDAAFAAQCAGLEQEFPHIRAHTEEAS
ncbi:MAG TPA: hypothetical protein VKE26_16860 [Xanthobacteraceae bacterium]|nr:hypothetical protein [Xanthobacteraceae bacterium]